MNEILQYFNNIFKDPSAFLYFLGVILPIIFSWLERFIQLKKQKAKIEQVEKVVKEESEKRETLVRYIELVLSLASEREKLTMIRAQGRASTLFVIGTVLMVLSVFAPIISLAAYITTEPLANDTLTMIKAIKDQIGITPSFNDIVNQRDWRILLSGVSFGFLFLAAARGILRQEGQQMTTFLNLARRVTYYENIVSALKIAERNELEKISELAPSDRPDRVHLENLVVRIINMLLEPLPELAFSSNSQYKPSESDELPIKENLESIIKSTK